MLSGLAYSGSFARRGHIVKLLLQQGSKKQSTLEKIAIKNKRHNKTAKESDTPQFCYAFLACHSARSRENPVELHSMASLPFEEEEAAAKTEELDPATTRRMTRRGTPSSTKLLRLHAG